MVVFVYDGLERPSIRPEERLTGSSLPVWNLTWCTGSSHSSKR
jgi:hypothetical protein